MNKIPCSLPILTLNAKASLERLLPRVLPFIDDVYIMDGNSTDGTQEYARSLGVRVEKQFDTDAPNQRIENFTAMRLRLWSKAKYRWLFILDADELPGPGLIDQVCQIVAKNDINTAHAFERHIVLPDERVVTHAFTYPDLYIRVFNLDSGVTLVNRALHERFVIPAHVREIPHKEGVLSGWPSLADMKVKMERYLERDLSSFAGASKARLARWGVYYNLKSFIGQSLKAIIAWTKAVFTGGVALPGAYTWLMLRYRLRMAAACLRKMFA